MGLAYFALKLAAFSVIVFSLLTIVYARLTGMRLWYWVLVWEFSEA